MELGPIFHHASGTIIQCVDYALFYFQYIFFKFSVGKFYQEIAF